MTNDEKNSTIPNDLIAGKSYKISDFIKCDKKYDAYFKYGNYSFYDIDDFIALTNKEKLEVLLNIKNYPSVHCLLNEEILIEKINEVNLLENIVEKLKKGIYIFGAYKVGLQIAKVCNKNNINILGFLDNDEQKWGKTYEGIKVYRPSDVSVNDEFVVVASGRHANSIINQVSKFNWVNLINQQEFLYSLSLPHQAESSIRTFVNTLLENRFKFISTFLELDDEESRVVFDGLIRMRLTLKTTVADDFKSPFQIEYFEPKYISTNDIRYFVDVGAYNGDTLDRLENLIGPVSRAYLFEPEVPSYLEGLKKYISRENIFYYNFGLFSEYSKIVFSSEEYPLSFGGPDDSFNGQYSTPGIQLIPLDKVLNDTISLLKIDVEGAENDVLMGAIHLIKKYRPKLCVCAYHRADDLWKLVDLVRHMDQSYKIGIRHYSDILDDTTIYFY